MSKPYDPAENSQRITKAVDTLMEHFDCVQIFVSQNAEGEHGGTVHHNYGAGNWFARYGQVRQWLVQKETRMMDETTSD